ncbi:MAG: indole-3-glycerol phosphate synthase TrpC [Gemmatimonadota bacterium]
MPETQGSNRESGILDRIVRSKKIEVEGLSNREAELLRRLEQAPPLRNLRQALRKGSEVALMAEVKRRSPGAGPIRPDLLPGELAEAYQGAGAAAISVLTDQEYFGGSLEDLAQARASVRIPVFRKDFILHPLQLVESRSFGADGVLLIARILSAVELGTLHAEAVALGLTPLVEVHGEDELRTALEAGADLIGVNNRNLQTFTTSLDVTVDLLSSIPPHVAVISESGIRTPEEVRRLGREGVDGILVGETLLRAADPGAAAAELVGHPRVGRTVT